MDEQILKLINNIFEEIRDIKATMVTKPDLDRVEMSIRKDMATKKDLEKFAKKEDLEKLAKKEDLEKFAKKEDLEKFAKKEDLIEMENRIRSDMATKDDIQNIVEEIQIFVQSHTRGAVEEHEDAMHHSGYYVKDELAKKTEDQYGT